jgi:hypothetical protein
MTFEIRSQREFAHPVAESGSQPDRLVFTFAIGLPSGRFDFVDVLKREMANVLDVQLLVRKLPNVVKKNHRFEGHRSVHPSVVTRNVESVRYEHSAGIEFSARAADVLQTLQRRNDRSGRRLNDHGLE